LVVVLVVVGAVLVVVGGVARPVVVGCDFVVAGAGGAGGSVADCFAGCVMTDAADVIALAGWVFVADRGRGDGWADIIEVECVAVVGTFVDGVDMPDDDVDLLGDCADVLVDGCDMPGDGIDMLGDGIDVSVDDVDVSVDEIDAAPAVDVTDDPGGDGDVEPPAVEHPATATPTTAPTASRTVSRPARTRPAARAADQPRRPKPLTPDSSRSTS
jgi:hypothetical protein